MKWNVKINVFIGGLCIAYSLFSFSIGLIKSGFLTLIVGLMNTYLGFNKR